MQQLRFFAHFCLYLRQIRQGVPLDAANTILQAYISLLEVGVMGHISKLGPDLMGARDPLRKSVIP